ncbi:MAG TPA: hypothetical protein VF518_08005, partial [Polyangia bacterium]
MKLPFLQRLGMKPGRSHLLVVGVLCILVLTIFQLSWWVIFHLRSSGKEIDVTAQHMEDDREAAERALQALSLRHGLGPGGPAEFLRVAYPHLDWQARAGADLLPSFPGYGVTIRPGRVEQLIAQRRSSIRMFTAEGATFLCILLAGTALIFRSVRR